MFKNKSLASLLLCIFLAATISQPSLADVRLPNIFGSNMVLQQEKPIRFFGWAEPGEKVAVSMPGKSAETTADAKGKWRVDLPAMKTDGKPFDVIVKGNNEITLKDVVLGEVWICSGQSNMEWPLTAVINSKEEIAAANYPNIRQFDVPGHTTSPSPNSNVPGQWKVCTPQTARSFSAVGYFFGRKLHKESGVPIGLIGTNWGGTRIEPWTPISGFASVPELKSYADRLKKIDPTTTAGQEFHGRYLNEVLSWLAKSREELAAGKTPGNPPASQTMRVLGQMGGATIIYNAMVHGLAPFSVRGAIWYQGESNAGDGLKYEFFKKALVNGWRNSFENEDLSFYWVQLANFQKPSEKPAGGGWGPVREGQRRALELKNTGMAVIIDIGAANDIHPRNKQDVGARLALWALRDHHGKKDLVVSGPLFQGKKINGNRMLIFFDHVGSGLMVGKKEGLKPTVEDKDGELKRFAIAGEDKKWHWAQAKIEGDTVVVWSDEVPEPVAVRYGFESNPVGANLYNQEGLPASPFKTDDWD
jgi:sialate O-acetylesterase